MKSALLVTVRLEFWCAYSKGGLAGKHGCGLARPDGDQSLSLSFSPCTDFSASEEGPRESVDAGCRNLTAPWVRDKAQSDASVELCGYFEDLENAGPEVSVFSIYSP